MNCPVWQKPMILGRKLWKVGLDQIMQFGVEKLQSKGTTYPYPRPQQDLSSPCLLPLSQQLHRSLSNSLSNRRPSGMNLLNLLLPLTKFTITCSSPHRFASISDDQESLLLPPCLSECCDTWLHQHLSSLGLILNLYPVTSSIIIPPAIALLLSFPDKLPERVLCPDCFRHLTASHPFLNPQGFRRQEKI